MISTSILLAGFNTFWAFYAFDKKCKGELVHDIGKARHDVTCVHMLDFLNVGLTCWDL